MERWYVAHTHTRSEQLALEQLRRQGFSAYLPQYRKRRRHARKTDIVRAPLFPSYLFISIDVARSRWRAIRSTIGIRHLICNGDRPMPVPDGVVEDIRSREDGSGLLSIVEPAPFAPGDTVRVTSGSFENQTGWFERLADNDRVIVLLNLLGRPTRLPLPRTAVAAFA